MNETILSNLAHTYRKLKDYKNAITFYEKCIALNSKNPYTYFSLAFTCHISNQLNKAICYYHKVFIDIIFSYCLHLMLNFKKNYFDIFI